MAAEAIRYGFYPLIAVVAAITGLEFAAGLVGGDPLVVTGILRTIDAVLIVGVSLRFADRVLLPGILPADVARGVMRGILWSVVFAILAGIGAAGLFLCGIDAFALIRVRLPAELHRIIVFFIVGGVVGPIAEELFFRGAIFGFFRRWGFPTALTVASVLFGLAHGLAGFGVPQLVGGIVFATAYEYEKNIVVPMVIHMSGNLALFSIGLF